MIAGPTEDLRRAAVTRLALRPGKRVLDLGCGTGLSLPLLQAAVGEQGVVYGVELSPEMLARARSRVAEAGPRNVRLLEANAETFELPEPVHGILCFYTHDILFSPIAMPRAVGFLAPGGRVVAAEAKLAHGWRGLINPLLHVDPVSDLGKTRHGRFGPFPSCARRASSSACCSEHPALSASG